MTEQTSMISRRGSFKVSMQNIMMCLYTVCIAHSTLVGVIFVTLFPAFVGIRVKNKRTTNYNNKSLFLNNNCVCFRMVLR